MKQYILVLIASCISLVSGGKTLNDSIPPGVNYNKAVFRLWYPDDCKTLSAIAVLMPGSNGDGRGQIDDPMWRDFAIKHGIALLGCWFTDSEHPDMFIENYIDVSKGSGKALLDVIRKFSETSRHPELANASLLLWGHSAGGQFNYEFVCWKPDRVIAFVVNKGGIYYTAMAPAEARKVPGILFTGEDDLEARTDIIKGLFSMNRRAGALWAYAQEPQAAHEPGQTQRMSVIFFDEVLSLRMDKGSTELKPLSKESGFLGDNKTSMIYPVSQAPSVEYPVSWLPGHSTAVAWLSFITKRPF
jgi:pimeloyl-ACP methyl ester carboxylesterase